MLKTKARPLEIEERTKDPEDPPRVSIKFQLDSGNLVLTCKFHFLIDRILQVRFMYNLSLKIFR
ncbi:hypothetical protein HanPI659440_Chr06g0237231 [Helianthus annuus]|nr:hypothetical protein HanIR_Chr06g0280301 [Helianthus annuus]KAJ0738039.1 hypothetical protein HanLR1_Chr06g0213601 [Helianthus annuus]KAJ0780404.1 hypothetical protein HanPI659440_Chr06g0237231 [Helianthus annuus]